MSQLATRRLSPTETAKEVRKALKATFKGTKFKVRTSKYAGGSSINVRWTDGPAERDVSALVNRFQGIDFNGMDDSTSYRDDVLLANEDGTLELVDYGASYVFADRDISQRIRENAAQLIAEFTGKPCTLSEWGDVDADGNSTFRHGTDWDTMYEATVFEGALYRSLPGDGERGGTLFRQLTARAF